LDEYISFNITTMSHIKQKLPSNKHQNLKHKTILWFTLVELIVVIVILAILATIAFLSFNSYSWKARDGNRLSNLKLTEKWLELSYISMWTYLMPEWTISTWTINGVDVAYNWYIWSRISNIIKLSTTPRDPVTNDYIDYWLTADKTKYQLAITLEESSSVSSKFDDNNFDKNNNNKNNNNYNNYNNDDYSFESLNNNLDNNINIWDINIINKNLIESANADNLYQAKVIWNYVWSVKFTSWTTTSNRTYYLANIPSLIFNFSWSSTTDLLSWSTAYYVLNKNTNLPYKIAGTDTINKKDWTTIIKEVTNSTSWALVMVDITAIVNATDSTTRTNLINSTFSWVNLVSFWGNINSVTSLVSGGVSSSTSIITIWTSSNPWISCNSIKTVRTSATDWLYWIDTDWALWNPAFQAYCDMTTEWWGWTLLSYTNAAKAVYWDWTYCQGLSSSCTWDMKKFWITTSSLGNYSKMLIKSWDWKIIIFQFTVGSNIHNIFSQPTNYSWIPYTHYVEKDTFFNHTAWNYSMMWRHIVGSGYFMSFWAAAIADDNIWDRSSSRWCWRWTNNALLDVQTTLAFYIK